LTELITTDRPPIRREAATALGRIGYAPAVAALLEGLREAGDPFLEHALILALIRIDDRDTTLPGLRDPDLNVRRGALTALHLMKHGGLTPDLVLPFLSAAEPSLEEVVSRIIVSRPRWGELVRRFFQHRLSRPVSPRERETLLHSLVALSADPQIQSLIALMLRAKETPVESRVLLLELIADAPRGARPQEWTAAVATALADPEEQVVRRAIAAAAALESREFDNTLLELARDRSRSPLLRIESVGAVAPRLSELESVLFELLRMNLDPERPPPLRLAAARALGQTSLSEDQLAELITLIPKTGSLVLPRLLPVFERPGAGGIGAALIQALSRSPGLRSLTPAQLDQVLGGYPSAVQRQADALRRRLGLSEEEKAAYLAELTSVLERGDARRGRLVFFSTKSACSACHSIGSQGQHVGPDLSKIGAIRTPRDLIEAVVFPSASFSRGYEPYTVVTLDGRTFSGRIARETSDELVLVSSDRPEVLIPRSSIETVKPETESLMPRGLESNLAHQELSDLITFLSSLK
jgi:putative heme-binding domain-containing protein